MKKYLWKYKKENLFIFLLTLIVSVISVGNSMILMVTFDLAIARDLQGFVR